MDRKYSMSQFNETWASLTQDERDEMNEKDRKGRIKSLAMKYGRRRVDAARKEVESDAKRTGRNTKKRPITWRELQGRIENTKNTLKPGEVRRWDKEKGKWVSNKEDVDEAVATAALTSPVWGPKALGLALTGIGAVGTYLQSKKKKEKKEDLLGAIRKKQAEIQQDVANQETLKRNQDFQDAETKRGKYVRRKQKPENQFVGEAAVAVATSPLWLPKALVGIGAVGTLANTVFKSDWYQRAQERKKIRDAERQASADKAKERLKGSNTDSPARTKDGKNNPEYIKDYRQKQKDDGTMGKTKPGGKWDKLPK